jgi:hypothetical protein
LLFALLGIEQVVLKLADALGGQVAVVAATVL